MAEATHGEIKKLSAVALVVAAGSSQRMGFDKIMAPLCGHPLLSWSLDAFEKCLDISYGVLVCSSERIEELSRVAAAYSKFRLVIAGGKERADSVFNGLNVLHELSPSIVAVHDAARPLVTSQLISAVVREACKHGAAAAAEPVRDTLHRTNDGIFTENVERENLWAAQTPQAANFEQLFSALSAACTHKNKITDEISALLAIGMHPRAVSHTALNFKITYPQDLELAEMILKDRFRTSDTTQK